MENDFNVVFFGDSICVGQGVSIFNGWVNLLARYFYENKSKFNDKNIIVSNSSVNGRTTRQALIDMPYTIQSNQVDILIIQFGLNDCNYWDTDNGIPRVSLDSYKSNIKEIINRGLSSNIKKVFLNNNHPTNTRKKFSNGIEYDKSNFEFSNSINSTFEKFSNDVIFTDIYHSFFNYLNNNPGSTISEFLLNDGLHLNVKGHEFYYELMKPLLEKEISYLV